jgi:hypothetical protein
MFFILYSREIYCRALEDKKERDITPRTPSGENKISIATLFEIL